MPVAAVLIASPSGFCAGVEAALKSLAWMLVLHPPPVYCVHAIVHNEDVVARFEALGVVFVDDVAEVPFGAPTLLSAHGSAPAAIEAARSRTGVVVDTVCPLVTKVHHELRARAAEGYAILYVGRPGHDEAVGAIAQAPGAVVAVPDAAGVAAAAVPAGRPVAVLAQTTLAVDRWHQVVDAAQARFGSVWVPPRDDICFATTNRQAAVRALAARCDAVVVVGSASSANTAALVDTARAAGTARVVRVAGPDELPIDLVGTVGVAAGASTPDAAINTVVARLDGSRIETVTVVDEHEHFPLAPPVRRAVASLVANRRLPADLTEAFLADRTTSAEQLMSLVAIHRVRTACAASST